MILTFHAVALLQVLLDNSNVICFLFFFVFKKIHGAIDGVVFYDYDYGMYPSL